MFAKLLQAIQSESPDAFKKILNGKKTPKNIFFSTDDKYGANLVHWAALQNQTTILQTIYTFLNARDRKKIFCAQDSDGRTPLHWCAYEYTRESSQFLVKRFPGLVPICENKGLSPLHLAAKNNQLSMVELLCDFDESDTSNADEGLISALTHAKKLPINLTTDADVALRLKTSSLRAHPCHPFFGVHLSTHRNYLANSPVASNALKESELYYRSEKHPLVHKLGEKAELFYKQSPTKLANGMKAHVGSYGNLLQMMGDTFKPDKHTPKHHQSDSKLYNSILNYKNNVCAAVAKEFRKKHPKSLIQVNHFNNYPSVMVFIPRQSIHKADDTKNPSPAAFENWVDFTLSYFTGLLNFSAWQKNLPIETERRGGFGFSTPTVAPTGASFRISMGIVPEEYKDLLVTILGELDKVLTKLSNNTLDISDIPKDIFYGKEEHCDYLDDKYELPEITDLAELLWAQVEKAGQTTVQNIMRTTYARDGVAAATFSLCHEKKGLQAEKAFNHALKWAAEKIEIKKNQLKFQTKNDLAYPVEFRKEPFICNDTSFWDIIDLMIVRISKLNDDTTKLCLKKITECREQRNLQDLYYYLDLLNESIFAHAITPTEDDDYGDGYGSDSEEAEEIDKKMIFAKKVVTHSGMRAIWAAVNAASSVLGDLRIYLQDSYYETPLGLKMIQKLNQLNAVTIVKKITEANVIIHDINACITNGSNSAKQINDLAKAKRYIILDATSATSDQIHSYLPLLTQGRTHSLLVAESGFKNQQLAGDKNPHGIIRVFSTQKEQCDNLYGIIKKSEKPLKSAASHRYRHDMKFFGATLSNESILSTPDDKEAKLKL